MLTDPEINAALAEKAMGWRRWVISDGSLPGCCLFPPHCKFTSGWIIAHEDVPFNKHSYFGPGYLPFNPTEDPAASHALKEAMRARGWRWYIQLRAEGFLARFYRADDWDEEIHLHPEYDATDPSELRAVALGACRALGIEGA